MTGPPFAIQLSWHRNAPAGDAATLTLTTDDGTPFDLTGYAFEMQGRRYPGEPDSAGPSASPLFDLGMAAEGSPGFFLLDAAGGLVEITPPTAATLLALDTAPTALNGKALISIDIIWTAPDGVEGIFAYGQVILYTGVTIP